MHEAVRATGRVGSHRDRPGDQGPHRHRGGVPLRSRRATGRWPRRARPGGRPRCWPRRCRDATCPTVPRPWRRRNTSWGGTRTRPCRSAPCPASSRSGSPPKRRRCPKRSHRCRWWPNFAATPRRGPRPWPRPEPATVRGSSRRGSDTASSPTGPSRKGGLGRATTSMSHARLTAAGQHQHGLGEHLAPVMQRQPLATDRDTEDSESPSPNRSANDPRACSPTWATTWSPPGSTTSVHRAVSVHLASALLLRIL